MNLSHGKIKSKKIQQSINSNKINYKLFIEITINFPLLFLFKTKKMSINEFLNYIEF